MSDYDPDMEQRYVDDPFEEEDLSWRTPKTGIDNLHAVESAMAVCGRKYFHSRAEKRKWERIDSNISSGTMPMKWLENCIEWARGKNKGRIIITLPKLTNLVLNRARMTDWLAENPDEGQRTRDYSFD
jgi:hypothetical protein